MPFLIIFAFLGGIVTILSPCILPILPIVLSSTLTGGKKRPIGIVIGFIASFTFFTLFLTAIVKATGLSADLLRNLSVVIIAGFGLSLLLPKFQYYVERLFSKLASIVPMTGNTTGLESRSDFLSGIVVGLSIGLVWTPCVGPILAGIIALAATTSVGGDAILVTLAYATGTAIPMLAITWGGRQLLQNNSWLLSNSAKIQKAFGILMILAALLIYFRLDIKFQSYILEKFPSYGAGLTKIEDNPDVKNELEKLQKKEPVDVAPEFIVGGQWFNSKPLTLKDLRGKVVLVDFWTYTCINCIRTFPYLKNWWDKYKDKGLVIVGVHTPEFEFEKNPNNVRRAIADFGLTYPVMQDNNYATWTAYNNSYWPAEYLIDVNGKIRHTHFGEGNYDDSEQQIQKLLKEAGLLTEDMLIKNMEYNIYAKTPETYLGFARLDNFSSPEQVGVDKPVVYSIPNNLSHNTFAFGGTWTVGSERTMPTQGAILRFSFESKEVFLVMRPKTQGISGQVKVLLDGKEVTTVTVDTDRLYNLITLPVPRSHILELQFLDSNLELYAFTFG